VNLKNITVTEINNAVTVYSERGRCDKMVDRKFYGLSLCSDGQITYIHNGQEFVSNKNCAVILPKGETYLIRRDKSGIFPIINFDCLENLCDTITVIPTKNANQLLADYERIKKIFRFSENRAHVFSIFYGMIHKLSYDGIPRELHNAVQMINNSYCDNSLTNAKLAAESNISEVYFRKLFTNHFGTSPKQYIIDMRIQKAKQLLSEGALSVSAVAEECGFTNQYHFARLFKQNTKNTPSEYRKMNLIYEI